MWETIREFIGSPNATVILVFVLMFVLIFMILTKTGLIQIHTDSVQIGAADRERNIIRQQLDWIRLHLQGMGAEIERTQDYNEYLAKYIIERCYDEYVDWITFNHISKSEAYIKIKQDKLVSLVMSLVVKEEYRTEEFKKIIADDVKVSIMALIQIREVYK